MERFVLLEKRSKKKQKSFYAGRRRFWRRSPVTRVIPSGKLYHRLPPGKGAAAGS